MGPKLSVSVRVLVLRDDETMDSVRYGSILRRQAQLAAHLGMGRFGKCNGLLLAEAVQPDNLGAFAGFGVVLGFSGGWRWRRGLGGNGEG